MKKPPDNDPVITPLGEDPGSDTSANGITEDQPKKEGGKPSQRRGSRNFLPIIMSMALFICFGMSVLRAQIEGSLTLAVDYTDNAFQLSDYDLHRFDQEHPNLEYVNTSDDLALSARLNLAYPFRYKWWRFTPSVTASLAQNVSNTEKAKRDAIIRFRVDRYYWNATVLYGYYPRSYIRDYVDTDGSGKLEHYSYERNLWRGDLNIKPLKNTTLRLNGRYEELFYNAYFTEFDGDAKTWGIGVRQNFPAFILEGMYQYRIFNNWSSPLDPDDSSYESDIYTGSLRMKPMPLSEKGKRSARWYPSLGLGYEEKFYQGMDDWYGGRVDKIYSTDAGITFELSDQINFSLDYSHRLRNVDSPNASVRNLKPYSENRFSAALEYKF
jgi:hypothetical protein